MQAFARVHHAARTAARRSRCMHTTPAWRAVTHLQMPAMSPTMTEGGISSWRKKEGDSFVAGDVLLEIETDKATIDVEAQDDGVLGKILLQDGAKNVPVGKVIALLAEEGDDISNLQPPAEEPAPPPPAQESAPTPPPLSPVAAAPPAEKSTPPPPPPQQHSHSAPPKHARPLFPSVSRLLIENNVASPEKIKGTGVRGMLTKGDVLAYLGQASGPFGTFKPDTTVTKNVKVEKKEEVKPLDGPSIRRLIVSTMLQDSIKARNATPVPAAVDFDDVIADYLPRQVPKPSKESILPPPTPKKSATEAYFDGLI